MYDLGVCVLYLEELSVVAVVHVADVQFAVDKVAHVVDGPRWRL
jgi:hypothetical protein